MNKKIMEIVRNNQRYAERFMDDNCFHHAMKALESKFDEETVVEIICNLACEIELQNTQIQNLLKKRDEQTFCIPTPNLPKFNIPKINMPKPTNDSDDRYIITDTWGTPDTILENLQKIAELGKNKSK